MIANQVYVFLWAILTGAALTLVFDFFRLLRRNKEVKSIIVYIQDFFFLLIVTIAIIASAFITNSGELRGYMVIGYILRILILFTLIKFTYTKNIWNYF